MTVNELSNHINEDITEPREREANDDFIRNIHAQLRDGGVWVWPDAMEVYRKDGDGFVRC